MTNQQTPTTMSTKTTYILFGSTNPYLAKFKGFNGRTRFAHSADYCTADEASAKLMGYHEQEDDNAVYSDDGTQMLSYGEVVMSKGDMIYEHDSRTWEYIAIGDLDEDDAAIVIRDGVLSDTELEEVYALHPDLRSEEEVEEDEDGATNNG